MAPKNVYVTSGASYQSFGAKWASPKLKTTPTAWSKQCRLKKNVQNLVPQFNVIDSCKFFWIKHKLCENINLKYVTEYKVIDLAIKM